MPWFMLALGSLGLGGIAVDRARRAVTGYRNGDALETVRSTVLAILMGLFAAAAAWGVTQGLRGS